METDESVQAPEVRKRPWRKYLKRCAISLVLLAVVLRAAVPLALPSILDKIAGQQGLQVSYSKLDLSLFAGSLELWDVSVRPLEESQEVDAPVLGQLEFLTLDVDVSALFGGTLRAHRVEIDGLDVYAKRESASGGWGWNAVLPEGDPVEAMGETAVTDADDDPSEPETSSQPFDWSLGFEASAIRLQHVQLHVEDHAMEPAFSADIELNVRLSHLGLTDRPARLEVFAHSLELLDGLALNGNLIANGPDLELACQVEMRGMRLRALEPYLTPLGVTPIASRIDCGLGLELSTKSANEHATALEVQASASDVHWVADGQELMALDEITLQVPNFSRVSLSVETARIRGVRGRVHRLADGAIAIAGFGLHGTGGSSKPQVNGVEQAEASPDSGEGRFEFSIPKLELSELALHWHDETLVPNPSLDLELQSMTVGPLVYAAGMASEPIHIEVHGAAPGVLETMDLVGDVQAFAETQSVELQMSMAGLKPDRIAPYLHAAGLSSDLQAGSGSLQISAQTHLDAEGVRHLQASLNDVQLQDGETLFALRSVALKGVQLNDSQASTRIDELSVDGTHLKVRRDPDGVWHCLGIALGADAALVRDVSEAGASQESVVVEAAPAPQAPGPVALFELDRLALTGTQIEILDESLEPRVHQVLDDLGLVVTGLSLGGDTSREQPSPAGIELWFRAAGLAERLALQGTLQSQPGPLHVSADLQVVGEGLELTAAEPWLQPLGIESLWNDARLGMAIKTGARKVGADTQVDLQLTD
ncbi:MAG: DUF748 domain-containing protein, partial [bacterium]|nr:DUF748 domain-containing protein [bacterium]